MQYTDLRNPRVARRRSLLLLLRVTSARASAGYITNKL